MNNVICERRIYTNQHSMHDHSFGQLILPLKGELNIKTDYNDLSVHQNNLFFLPPKCKHLFHATQPNEFLVLDIPPSYMKSNDMNKIIGGKEIILDDKWKALKHLFLSEIKQTNSSISINNLFIYCYQMLTADHDYASIQYIDEHYTEDIELKTLATLEGYNIAYYSEWFKAQTGFTPFEYIQHQRIKKSKDLLLNTDLIILQVGYMVGYTHHSSFTRTFKRITNLTPKEFRLLSK